MDNRRNATEDERKKKVESKHTEEGRTKYRQLNNELRRETEKAKAV